MDLARPDERETGPYHCSLSLFTTVRRSSCGPIAYWILARTSDAVRIHDSQAYRKMNVTLERISRALELREILLSLPTGFNLVNAAVVCAILEIISGLEPSSVITEPRYLKMPDSAFVIF